MKLRIGTRRSKLAMTQADEVARLLADRTAADTEIVGIATDDAAIEDKARFTNALEAALLSGDIDIAVHSAKDVPAILADGTELAAVPPRAQARDVFVFGPRLAGLDCRSVADLPEGAVVGTSSVRRRSQLLAIRPDIEVVALRGNVDSRIEAANRGELDAIVLGHAGLQRLGRDDEIAFVADPRDMLPAAGQGALLVQTLETNDPARAACATIDDIPSRMSLLAERAVVISLGADCDTPVAAYAVVAGDTMTISGWAGSPDGDRWVKDTVIVAAGNPEGAGGQLARRMNAAGAAAILRDVRLTR